MKRPVILHGGRNEGDRVWQDSHAATHRAHGPAVEWTDGYKAWYWHGDRWRDNDWPIIETGHIEIDTNLRGAMMNLMLRDDAREIPG